MEYHNNKFLGFTLPEVLITIVIIGVVAAMTLSPLITKIRNKGFVERLNKTYSVLQNATNQIVEENGTPSTWPWTVYTDATTRPNNEKIFNYYKKHLKVIKDLGNCPAWACPIDFESYRYLNGDQYVSDGMLFVNSPHIIVLSDGVTIGMLFRQTSSGGVYWGLPDLLFTVDVNGKAGPNQIGRDVFWFYLKKSGDGKILPYANETFPDGAVDNRNTCEPDLKGYSCAYRIITEGGMNY